MSDTTCTLAPPAAVTPAPTPPRATPAIAARIAKPAPSRDRPRQIAHRRADGDRQPPAGEAAARDHDAHRSRKQDLAFQARMRIAIAAGREHPPMVGVFKDDRPLDAPRLFAPVPHSSGCSSPAGDCAALASTTDGS